MKMGTEELLAALEQISQQLPKQKKAIRNLQSEVSEMEMMPEEGGEEEGYGMSEDDMSEEDMMAMFGEEGMEDEDISDEDLDKILG